MLINYCTKHIWNENKTKNRTVPSRNLRLWNIEVRRLNDLWASHTHSRGCSFSTMVSETVAMEPPCVWFSEIKGGRGKPKQAKYIIHVVYVSYITISAFVLQDNTRRLEVRSTKHHAGEDWECKLRHPHPSRTHAHAHTQSEWFCPLTRSPWCYAEFCTPAYKCTSRELNFFWVYTFFSEFRVYLQNFVFFLRILTKKCGDTFWPLTLDLSDFSSVSGRLRRSHFISTGPFIDFHWSNEYIHARLFLHIYKQRALSAFTVVTATLSATSRIEPILSARRWKWSRKKWTCFIWIINSFLYFRIPTNATWNNNVF